jgi:hypothetical protein
MLDAIMDKTKETSVSKSNINLVYQKIMSTVNEKMKTQIPTLSKPDTMPLPAEYKLSEHGNFSLHKATRIIFQEYNNELVAYGAMLDDNTYDENNILKLGIQDLVVCVNNGWRFLAHRSIVNNSVFVSSPYCVHI